jgi:hypothetical protein
MSHIVDQQLLDDILDLLEVADKKFPNSQYHAILLYADGSGRILASTTRDKEITGLSIIDFADFDESVKKELENYLN